MLTERELVKVLDARMETDARFAPERHAVARDIIRTMAPDIMKIIRQEVAEERRRNAC